MKDTGLYQQLLGLTEPWGVSRVALDVPGARVEVYVAHQAGASWCCPECGKECVLYDHAAERTWRHLDTCQFQTHLHARLPRVNCPEHGVRNVAVPWAEKGGRFTLLMERLLIDLLEQCQSILGVCRITGISWEEGAGVMARAVARGRARKEAVPLRYLGVDEKAYRRGHHYVTVVSDLERGTVEYVAEGRRIESLAGFYQGLSAERRAGIAAVALDMGEAYVQATCQHLPAGHTKIVFDRFHIMQRMNEILDQVRRGEQAELSRHQNPILNRTRQLWLWGQERLPERYRDRFAALKSLDLQTAKVWALKENLRRLWDQVRLSDAQAHLAAWCAWARRLKLPPVARWARTLQAKATQILSYYHHPITSAGCEGLNSKIGTLQRKAAGFRNFRRFLDAIFFYCGKLDLYPR
jgi:transposase